MAAMWAGWEDVTCVWIAPLYMHAQYFAGVMYKNVAWLYTAHL